MTNWNLSFDYVAVFLLLLIFVWYFNERRIPIRSHRVFLIFLSTAFTAAGLEIIATHMARNIAYVGFDALYNVLTLQTFAINMVPMSFAWYLLLLAHVDVKRNPSLWMLYRLGFLTDVIITVLNPWLHWAFRFENDRYQTGSAGLVMYGIDAVMLLVGLVVMISSKRKFSFLHIIPLAFNFVFGIVAAVGQVFLYVPMVNLMIAILCLTLYHYLQNSGMVTDAVTNQFNRKFMGEYIENQYMMKKRFAVVMVAMDDFKFINKTYGVDNGDHLLFQVGNFLEQIKMPKMIFRFGSDQFCVVLDKNVDEVDNLTEQIQARFRHPWIDETQAAIMMSASICCIECPRDAADYRELIEVIDYSMSLAKKTRKGGITKASEIDLDKLQRDKAIEKAVKLAIDRDELMVYYQPIFSVQKGVYNSAEALVRLHDDELGWISPEDFIPIAEKNGLILEMGELILEKVCRFIRDFNLSETTVEYIEVNISPLQLVQTNFSERVKQLLEKYHVNPSQINIEITETATLNSASTVADNINSLVDYGVSFSLDDYGSGNANIDYINHMPFKIIKIDKYIIWDSFKNSKAGITLEYTIGMLNALELYIVAEGVETEEMKHQLAEFGCHYMQGWYYSKAVPAEEFIALLQQAG
ncbi:MAG: bifunctional diguanylate cyclase/phosphodiesterase [Lachnospiraceae bacterium]|nr:bifunctional diguanylate cyclase/phosphodiesterase [Lachnospiraceae bacterium]